MNHAAQTGPADAHRPLRVGYLVSRFPKLTETFILQEMIELQHAGFTIELCPLIHHVDGAVHPEALPFEATAHYVDLGKRELWHAHAAWLRRCPGRYLATWFRVLTGCLCSPAFLIRAVMVMLQAAYFARLLEHRVDLIHAHWATHPTLAAWIIHRLTGLPYGFTTHAHDIFVDRTLLCMKAADACYVVTVSEYNRAFLEQHCGTDVCGKIEVIHLGVDPQRFTPRPVPPRTPFRVLCIASLEEYKGHPVLIEACAKLRAEGLDIVCDCIGGGAERAHLQRLVYENGVEATFHFLGHRSRSEVQQALAQAHVMALPSIITRRGKQEGIPVALMEAMAMTVPVIASHLSGIPELIDGEISGLLVPPGDANALARAIRRLHDDPALAARLGIDGRRTVERSFTLRTNVDALAEVMRSHAYTTGADDA